jgi:hypothetical protein
MQRIYRSPLTPETYQATQAHRQVRPDSVCFNCGQTTTLQRHGFYERWVLSLTAQLLTIWIARFLCLLCKRTISYLPDFALTYRFIGPSTFEAFLREDFQRCDVRPYWPRLRLYRSQLNDFFPELVRTVGAGLGMPPPAPTELSAWPWLQKAGEALDRLTRRLVTVFKIGLFRRYLCHQPAFASSGSPAG